MSCRALARWLSENRYVLVASEAEVGGIPGVAVKCVEIGRNTSGEGGLLGFN